MSIAEKILSLRESRRPIHNDLVVLHSSVDYDVKGNYLKYLLFDIVNEGSGSQKHFFKAIKLYRLIRVPNNDRIANFLMEKQSEVLAALWGNQINFLSLVANILKPKPIGLVYTYGVQGVGNTIEEAKAHADESFAGLTSALKGVFRTIEFRNYNYEEAEWLRKKMVGMKNLALLRGIPYPHQSTANPAAQMAQKKSSNSSTPQTETMEEFIAGMGDHEYVMVTMATPVSPRVLEKWLTLVSREESKWASIMSGSSSVNFSVSLPMMFGGNLGGTTGISTGTSHSVGQATGHVQSWTDGTTQGTTAGTSHTLGDGTSLGFSHGDGTSHTTGTTNGVTHTTGTTTTNGTTDSTTHSTTNTTTHSTGTSHTTSNGTSSSTTSSTSSGTSGGSSWNDSSGSSSTLSNGTSQSTGTSESKSTGTSSSNTNSRGNSVGGSVGAQEDIPGFADASQSINYGHNWGESWGTGKNSSTSDGTTSTNGSSSSASQGVSSSSSSGGSSGWTDSTSTGSSYGTTSSVSNGTTVTNGTSTGVSNGTSDGTTHSVSNSSSTANSTSNSVANGNSTNQSWSNGTSTSLADGITNSNSFSSSQSQGQSNSQTNSVSNGTTMGNSTGWNLGTSSTMGMSPGISIGKSYQWKDTEVENVVKIIDFVKERLTKSLNGQGAFFVDVMIGTETDAAHDSVKTISKAAFYYKDAYAQPLQVLEPKQARKDHLLYHFSVFSPCTEKETNDGNYDAYKYSTVLLPDELTAYTHPPRMSDGGLYADVEDMPQLSVPSDRQNGDVYMGHILSGQRWSEEEYRRSGNGYLTPFKYSVYSSEIMHTVFQGESRSGKTVAAIRFIAGLSKAIRPSGKRMRIVVFDQKDDWRKLQRLVEPERFRFYKIDSTDELGLKVNLCKIAPNVHPETHIKTLAEIFVSAYGLGILGSQIMKDGLFELYQKRGCIGEDWREKAHVNSAKVTLSDLYDLINQQFQEMGRQGGNNMKDAYQRVLVRLKDYATKGMILHEIFSTQEGIAIHELMGKDDVIVIEGNNLDRIEKNFIYGMMFATIYSWGVNNGTFLAEDNYETYCVVEEANSVLIGQGSGDGNSGDNLPGQSRFESIVDMAAGLGFFIAAITQKIQDMPPSIVNSCGLWFIGRTKATKAHEIILPAFGKNSRYEFQYSKWLSRSPDLWFMCMAGRTTDFKTSTPVHVLIDLIPVGKPTDAELLEHRRLQEIAIKQAGSQRDFVIPRIS